MDARSFDNWKTINHPLSILTLCMQPVDNGIQPFAIVMLTAWPGFQHGIGDGDFLQALQD